jgi:hypothetical protein
MSGSVLSVNVAQIRAAHGGTALIGERWRIGSTLLEVSGGAALSRLLQVPAVSEAWRDWVRGRAAS